MSESNEQGIGEPFTDDELKEFISGPEAPSFHPILQVWKKVLEPAAAETETRITPQWASRIIQSYPGLGFGDMPAYRTRYFAKIVELEAILDHEIGLLTIPFEQVTSPEDDTDVYSEHYKNLLLVWQMAVLQWELDWDCTDVQAAAELAAISEVHKMFFGPTGLVQYLDNIKLEFTEADQALLGEALEEMKDGR